MIILVTSLKTFAIDANDIECISCIKPNEKCATKIVGPDSDEKDFYVSPGEKVIMFSNNWFRIWNYDNKKQYVKNNEVGDIARIGIQKCGCWKTWYHNMEIWRNRYEYSGHPTDDPRKHYCKLN